jgi:hypothetical protein
VLADTCCLVFDPADEIIAAAAPVAPDPVLELLARMQEQMGQGFATLHANIEAQGNRLSALEAQQEANADAPPAVEDDSYVTTISKVNILCYCFSCAD